MSSDCGGDLDVMHKGQIYIFQSSHWVIETFHDKGDCHKHKLKSEFP